MRLNEREVRTLPKGAAELRASDDDGTAKIGGYAMLFDVDSDDMFFGEESIAPEAVTKTLKEADVRALWNHNSDKVLGRNVAGTLALRQDDKGLLYEAITPATTWARDAVVSIERGDVTQSSFGFRTIRDEWRTVDGVTKRRILEMELFDVSPVTFPAYPQTDVAVRSLLRHEGAEDADFDRYTEQFDAIREGSLTNAEYRSIVGGIVLELRDRQPAPGHRPHSEDDQRQPSTETQRLALDLLEVE